MDLQIYLPWPPTVNSYYGKARNGVVFIKAAGKAFRKAVDKDLEEQLPSGFAAVGFRMAVGLVFYPPDNRKRDLDNYKKALFDACSESGLWIDDSLIDQDYSFRGQKVDKGRVLLVIREAGPVLPFSMGLKADIIDF